jgi:alpha-L-arabinofuranosidase
MNSRLLLATILALPLLAAPAQPAPVTVTVQAGAPGKPISPDLFGIFFEDLNYAADGGLYAELVQNRSFEYAMTEQPGWNNLTAWELQERGGRGGVVIDYGIPLHANNPHYAVLELGQPGDVALVNSGFDGIPVTAGGKYNLSLFARQLYIGGRWGSENRTGALPLTVRLEGADGAVLGEAKFDVTDRDWKRFSATITASRTDPKARLAVIAHDQGGLALDDVSLFPAKTFHNRPNGLRADLAQTIADLHPKFVRFPGGCLTHGNGLPNIYRWKDTIGPVEQRRQQPNLWGYHQTVGLGYYEYFQFCEDIGAKPLPVVAAAVSCQNSGHTGGTGQQCLPLADMPAYIQDVLDLIEWANGPATSKWGAKRAAAGHPAPFHLQYLGVGNEDHITPGFKERFQMIFDAVKKAHPEITVIGTVGPSPAGPDYDAGWKIANELKVPIVDEHYYENPEWFLGNQGRYDGYDRTKSKVYLGEYASRGNTLFNALAEAAYMTALERNGDVVHMASYAPLLAKMDHTQWRPDLIYFTNEGVFPSINYYVQGLFSRNSGDRWLPATVSPPAKDLAVSAVRDSKSGDLILKLVNTGSAPQPLRLVLSGAKNLATSAVATVLTGDPRAVNDPGTAQPLLPKTTTLAVGPNFAYEAPANSLTVLRIPARKVP